VAAIGARLRVKEMHDIAPRITLLLDELSDFLQALSSVAILISLLQSPAKDEVGGGKALKQLWPAGAALPVSHIEKDPHTRCADTGEAADITGEGYREQRLALLRAVEEDLLIA